MKAIYRHKRSGDIFAIETDESGNVISTCGPLFSSGFDPKMLDFDEYWNPDIKANLEDFQRIDKDEYIELLHRNGFFIQQSQGYLFDHDR